MRLFELPHGPVDDFGSAGVLMDLLPPLVDAGRTGVSVLRVAAGGTLGRHPAPRRQVFAVLSGAGETCTGDGPRVALRAGTLVVWEAGEVHQTWAVEDLTAVVVETEGEVVTGRFFTEVPGPAL